MLASYTSAIDFNDALLDFNTMPYEIKLWEGVGICTRQKPLIMRN